MVRGFEIDMPKKGLDDLFSTQEQRDDDNREKVQIIPFDLLDDMPSHPFKVKMDVEMRQLIESVKQFGILVPGLVKPKSDGRYLKVAGHRRAIAGIEAGVAGLPAIVRDMSDEEAIIIMVDSNLQRERILPSEKAFAYKMKMEAMNRQGQRTDLTYSQVGNKLKGITSSEIFAKEVGESKNQIFRYIRLTELIPKILEMVDDERIKFNPAVEISFLSVDRQKILYEVMDANQCTPSYAQAIKMKQLEQAGSLSNETIVLIMEEEKGNQIEQFKLPKKTIERFFPSGTRKEEMQETIIKALEIYTKQRDRDRSDERER